MNILHLVPALESGGVETGTIDLAVSLKKLGHAVTVISNGGPLTKELASGGVSHVRLPVHKKSPFTVLVVPRIASIIKKNHINIIHASSRVPAWVGFLASKLTGVPFVTSCHGFYSKHFLSSVMGRGKLVMVISKTIGERMVEAFGVPREKIRLVYRGVDLAKYTYCPDKYEGKKDLFRVINIGRLTPIKGQHEFIKAMKRVSEKVGRLEAWIVGGLQKGKSSYAAGLRETVESLGLENCVKFLGLKNDVPELLKKCDLLILSTNVPEGFGRTIIEAGAVGTACCGSNVGGIREIIDDGVTGLLFSPGNDVSMADAVTKMLGSPELCGRCAGNLRKKVEKFFTLEEMARKTFSVYKEAIEK